MSHLRLVRDPPHPLTLALAPLPDADINTLLAAIDTFAIGADGVVRLTINDLGAWLAVLPLWSETQKTEHSS